MKKEKPQDKETNSKNKKEEASQKNTKKERVLPIVPKDDRIFISEMRLPDKP